MLLNFRLAQRLQIGVIKSNTRRPSSPLTHADVMAALHFCEYDLPSAEASFVALQRRRLLRYSAASAGNDARSAHLSATGPAGGASVPGNSKGGKSNSRKGSSIGQIRGPEAENTTTAPADGNRWEDWSEADRAAFLTHLGDKVIPYEVDYCACFPVSHAKCLLQRT